MSKVVASFKIFPADADVNLADLKEAIKSNLPKEAYVHRFEEEPIAFGLVSLIAHVVFPEDEAGEMEKVEEAVKKTEGVGEAEVFLVRRI
ncbi:elongation factor 1-beta [Candidatus Hecatella orcuttiae]|jgi:elongation factor 1-beta|uniref:elongation factor 1-beta n=1 Tax=Candidatus Hecatella orcuttiae TaxID=1935119 RepID=UPI00286818C0|nr:elongation factor 1-beta [Candidatus Hecatella orcuttiae]